MKMPSGKWSEVEPLLKKGKLYLQDPGTRLAMELLAPAGRGNRARCVRGAGRQESDDGRSDGGGHGARRRTGGRVIAMDLPGDRIARLKENLSRAEGVEVALVQADVAKDRGVRALDACKLPTTFDAVLLDVPCRGTPASVRHRVDVKWRLPEGDFHKHQAPAAGASACGGAFGRAGRSAGLFHVLDRSRGKRERGEGVRQPRGRAVYAGKQKPQPTVGLGSRRRRGVSVAGKNFDQQQGFGWRGVAGRRPSP